MRAARHRTLRSPPRRRTATASHGCIRAPRRSRRIHPARRILPTTKGPTLLLRARRRCRASGVAARRTPRPRLHYCGRTSSRRTFTRASGARTAVSSARYPGTGRSRRKRLGLPSSISSSSNSASVRNKRSGSTSKRRRRRQKTTRRRPVSHPRAGCRTSACRGCASRARRRSPRSALHSARAPGPSRSRRRPSLRPPRRVRVV